MKDGNPEDISELWNLIKREIDARDWFLYLDSENARKSEWVQHETAYAEENKNGYIIKIDLNHGMDEIKQHIYGVSRAMRVYLTYSESDKELYDQLKAEFLKQDFQILNPERSFIIKKSDTTASFVTVMDYIDVICSDGCYVPIITKNTVNSPILKSEMVYVLSKKNAFAMPIITKDAFSIIESDGRQPGYIKKHNYCLLDEREIHNTVDQIRQALIKKISKS